MEREAERTPSNSPSSELHRGAVQTSRAAGLTSTKGIQESPVNPLPEVMAPSGDPHLAKADRQSRVFILPESYRGIGGDICLGYGSLSRTSLHSYWPAKNFQTLPFLRDSYASSGLSDGDQAAAGYPALGGVHQFRPITAMELLREPSRTR